MNTPKSKVHWALDSSPNLSEFGSPFSDTSIVDTTSSLQYINSQLVAHGFTSSPGLSLDGVPAFESEKVIKCLLGMLAQRVVSPSLVAYCDFTNVHTMMLTARHVSHRGAQHKTPHTLIRP